MRTNIEIREEHRAKLLELAARRGEKGISRIVAEALDAYFKALASDEENVRRALKLRGSLSRPEADRLRAEVVRNRESWR